MPGTGAAEGAVINDCFYVRKGGKTIEAGLPPKKKHEHHPLGTHRGAPIALNRKGLESQKKKGSHRTERRWRILPQPLGLAKCKVGDQRGRVTLKNRNGGTGKVKMAAVGRGKLGL